MSRQGADVLIAHLPPEAGRELATVLTLALHTEPGAVRVPAGPCADLRCSRTAGGSPVLHHPALPWADPYGFTAAGHVSAETLVPDLVEARTDLGYVVMVPAQQCA